MRAASISHGCQSVRAGAFRWMCSRLSPYPHDDVWSCTDQEAIPLALLAGAFPSLVVIGARR